MYHAWHTQALLEKPLGSNRRVNNIAGELLTKDLQTLLLGLVEFSSSPLLRSQGTLNTSRRYVSEQMRQAIRCAHFLCRQLLREVERNNG